MKIEIHRSHRGTFREVGFFDLEDESVVAHSGLLDGDDAMELATRLREVALELATFAQEARADERQTVLPLFGGVAA